MSSLDSAGEASVRSPSRWRRALTGALVLGATIAGLVAAGPRLLAEMRGATLFAADQPGARIDREIAAEFGFENPVVWVIEPREGTIWTPPMLARVTALTREALTIPGVVATDVLSLASPTLRDLRVTEHGLEPVYLMGTPPETPEAAAALRTRVEGDPRYAGTLVARDGSAAMVVANFAPGADALAVGTAALALRDRHRDALADVHATGAPVIAVLVARGAPALALPLGLLVAAGLVWLGIVAGGRRELTALAAATLATAWLGLVLGSSGVLALPWSLFALAPTAFVAAAMSLASFPSPRAVAVAAGALALGFASLGLTAGAPVSAFAAAGAVGAVLAVPAAALARWLARPAGTPPRDDNDDWRSLSWVLLVGALFGLGMLGASFGVAGYGLRWLPGEAGREMRAVVRRFPPPTTIAIRLRGAPGFVQEPAVLRALDAAATAARAEPGVESAMSLADVVKLVHRAFNDDDPEFERIPEERPLVARYLALAYSPGFRRFVDRGFARTVVWASVASERPADVARVAARMQAALAAAPLPGVVVDPPAGDGAMLLAATETARGLAVGSVVLLVVVVLGAALGCGRRAAVRAAASALGTGVTALGLFGWLGLPLDLVTLPATVGALAASAAVGALAAEPAWCGRYLALTLLAAGAVGIAVPLAATRLVGILLVAPAVGLGIAPRALPAPGKVARKARLARMAQHLHRGTA
jgi:hypothetical protein